MSDEKPLSERVRTVLIAIEDAIKALTFSSNSVVLTLPIAYEIMLGLMDEIAALEKRLAQAEAELAEVRKACNVAGPEFNERYKDLKGI